MSASSTCARYIKIFLQLGCDFQWGLLFNREHCMLDNGSLVLRRRNWYASGRVESVKVLCQIIHKTACKVLALPNALDVNSCLQVINKLPKMASRLWKKLNHLGIGDKSLTNEAVQHLSATFRSNLWACQCTDAIFDDLHTITLKRC